MPHETMSPQLRAYLDDIRLLDLQGMHLLLEGSSIIDWPQPTIFTEDEAWRLLTANRYRKDNPRDLARMRYLINNSAEYLEETFGYAVPNDLLDTPDIGALFVIASTINHPHQRLAWMLVKVIHVMNHIHGRELGHLLAISDRMLFQRAQGLVADCVDKMREIGIGVHEYQSSMKTQESLITKLLSKSNTIAAQIFDKVRFRVILDRREDLFPALLFMTRELLPFNYVIPGETRNDIVGIQNEVLRFPHLVPTLLRLAREHGVTEGIPSINTPFNPATAQSYQVINFVLDMPIRADEFLEELGLPYTPELGALVFVLVEFQVFDKATYEKNEAGPARHSLYKERQKQMVLNRLVRGLPNESKDKP